MAAQVPGVKAREALRMIQFPGGGEVWFKSADQPDNLRGEGLDYLIIDEADYIDGDVWEQVLRPALADRKGGAIWISTPRIEGGYFHQGFLRGQNPNDPEWKSWQFPSESNPFLDPKEIAAARAQLPDVVARREFGAEFVSAGGALIQKKWIQTGKPTTDLRYFMGVDLAISTRSSADWTACVTLGRDPKTGTVYIVDAKRIRAPFHQVIRFVQERASVWHPSLILIEQVAFQAAAVQELLRTTNLPVKGVKPDRDKVTRFAGIQAQYERMNVFHAPDLDPNFEREILSFPVGVHDDLVDALSTAWTCVQTPINYFKPQMAPSRWNRR